MFVWSPTKSCRLLQTAKAPFSATTAAHNRQVFMSPAPSVPLVLKYGPVLLLQAATAITRSSVVSRVCGRVGSWSGCGDLCLDVLTHFRSNHVWYGCGQDETNLHLWWFYVWWLPRDLAHLHRSLGHWVWLEGSSSHQQAWTPILTFNLFQPPTPTFNLLQPPTPTSSLLQLPPSSQIATVISWILPPPCAGGAGCAHPCRTSHGTSPPPSAATSSSSS